MSDETEERKYEMRHDGGEKMTETRRREEEKRGEKRKER